MEIEVKANNTRKKNLCVLQKIKLWIMEIVIN